MKKLNDIIEVEKGRICTTFPLSEFKYYMGEERDNDIEKGIIIEAKNFVDDTMHTLLIKDLKTDKVCAIRTYDDEYVGKVTKTFL